MKKGHVGIAIIALSVVLFVLVVVAVNGTEQASAITSEGNQDTALSTETTSTAPKASDVTVAEVSGETQSVTINTTGAGYEPKVVVVQKGVPASFEFNLQGRGCDQLIVFPQINKEIDLTKNPVVMVTPTEDFQVSCSMGMYGFQVKVVDDINAVDVNEIQNDIANNPSLYSTSGNSGGCCSSN